jgi:hypothetical protein
MGSTAIKVASKANAQMPQYEPGGHLATRFLLSPYAAAWFSPQPAIASLAPSRSTYAVAEPLPSGTRLTAVCCVSVSVSGLGFHPRARWTAD